MTGPGLKPPISRAREATELAIPKRFFTVGLSTADIAEAVDQTMRASNTTRGDRI